MSDAFLREVASTDRYEVAKSIMGNIGFVSIGESYSTAVDYCDRKCKLQGKSSPAVTCVGSCPMWNVKSQTLAMKKAIEKIEQKADGLLREGRNDILIERAERIRHGSIKFQDNNLPLDSLALTSQLTDGEFTSLYAFRQYQLYNHMMRQYSLPKINCIDCNTRIVKPSQLLILDGVPYHGRCLRKAIEVGKQKIPKESEDYMQRVLQTVQI